ncbi:MAG: putative dehydrogenase [Rhodothermales bacterium]
MDTRLGLAQIGLGRWGPNLFRNFVNHPEVDVLYACDRDESKLAKVQSPGLPLVETTTDAGIIFADPRVQAVVVATPVSTHFALCKQALEAGKHVMVEKPLAGSVAECEELVALADARGLKLMVGHVFVYNRGIRYIKNLIDSGELGDIHCIHSQRTNLGPIRLDTNSLWDLGTHDISIFNYWLGNSPTAVSSVESHALGGPFADIVNTSFYYPNNVLCQVLCSWLHPEKVRRIIVVGAQKMVVWDDMRPDAPVTIYDKGVETKSEQTEGTFAEFGFMLRGGDVRIPMVPMAEPLRTECNEFVRFALHDEPTESDGHMGLQVVRILAAADESHRRQCALVDPSSLQ